MIQSVNAFVDYFESIRRRTLHYAQAVPAEQIDWSPREGEFTCGDIVRHLAATEQMYITLVTESRWFYPGHERGQHNTLAETLAHLAAVHETVLPRLRALPDTVLLEPRPPLIPDSHPVKVWRWLMVMVEHEVHHRSQLASYLTWMGAEAPQIYGVGVEELIARATG